MKKHGQFLGRAPRVRLEITKKHIKEGTVRNSNHCMIAEALRDAHPELSHIAVDLATIRATDRKKKERYTWLTPRVAQSHLIKFDQKMRLSPISFFLREGQVTVSGSDRLKNYKKKHRKARLRKAPGGGTNVPERVGGRTPPRMTGQRRAYGLRALVM